MPLPPNCKHLWRGVWLRTRVALGPRRRHRHRQLVFHWPTEQVANSQDPAGVLTLGGQPFVHSAMSNGDMTIHRVVVTVYPRPDALLGDECP